jgi:fatty-acyl-CoA synthase
MTAHGNRMTDAEKARFNLLNKENLDFLMDRYNRVNRWVIADMIRRTAYHHPDKTAIIFGEQSLTYAELEAAANRTANALAGLGCRQVRPGGHPGTQHPSPRAGLAGVL